MSYICFPSQSEMLNCLNNQTFGDIEYIDASIKSLAAKTFANQTMNEAEFKDKVAIVLYESLPVDLISVKDYMFLYKEVLERLQECGAQTGLFRSA